MFKCKSCNNPYPRTTEYFPKNGRYLKTKCKKCFYADPNRIKEDKEKARIRIRDFRRNNPVKTYLYDSRSSDRKKGFENNLTEEFIEEKFQDPCSYCDTVEIAPSLDRINNDKGHTQDNVIPCCVRCNYIRRDIPYEAWLVIAKAVKEASNKGLLDSYTTFARFNKRHDG